MDALTITQTHSYTGADISIPSSKSYIHRRLIAALLAEGESVIDNVAPSEDVRATLSCIKALGAGVSVSDNGRRITVSGGLRSLDFAELNCGESASTLRFFIPVATLFCKRAVFTGAPSLMNRPVEPYFDIFDDNGIKYEYKKGEYLKIEGSLKRDVFTLDGTVSSQFVTGMLFTLPLLGHDSTLKIRGGLQSAPYVDITNSVLADSGIEVANNGYESFFVRGAQRYTALCSAAPGDYSQAAFFLVAGCIRGGVTVGTMAANSLQGDRVIVDILKNMGADIGFENGRYTVEKSRLRSVGEIDAADFPDLVPILSLACALAEGTTVIKGIERLRFKECDRINATEKVLSSLGADISQRGDTLVINGKGSLAGGTADSFNDHRMAMTAAIASLACEGSVTILRPMSVNKSYPKFYDDLLLTGGVKYEWNMGK